MREAQPHKAHTPPDPFPAPPATLYANFAWLHDARIATGRPDRHGLEGVCEILEIKKANPSGDGLDNGPYSYISGGTFTGAEFNNSDFTSTISGGTFSGAGFTNLGKISGGTFMGDAATYSKSGNSILAQTPYGISVLVTIPQLDILGTGLI